MRIRLFTLLSAYFLNCAIILQAQDLHLSQYYAYPVLLNPATTGMFEGDYRAHLHYRSQWKSLIANPYTGATLGYDQPYERFGIGGYITNFRAGTGGLNFLNVIVSGAYKVTIDPENIHNLTTGLQLGIIHKSINVSNLSFDNQYSVSAGNFDPNQSSRENFSGTSVVVPEVNFGIFYYYDNSRKWYKPYIGVSGFHLTFPKETFMGRENRYTPRVVGYGGSMMIINETISVNPNLLYMHQSGNNEFQFGAIGYYHFKDTKIDYFLGPYYRNNDAMMIHTGIVYDEYIFRISYDVNTSSLNRLTKGQGGFEISVTYTKEKGRFIPSLL